jgi:hypothetical protein
MGLVLLASLAVAAPASADGTVVISASRTNILRADDAPVALRLTGTVPAPGAHGSDVYQLMMQVTAPSDGSPVPCDLADVPVDPTRFFNLSATGGGAFGISTSYPAREAGTYAVCAWLVATDPSTGDMTGLAVAKSSFAARAPHLSLRLTAPKSSPAGHSFRIGVVASSDGEADLDVVVWTPGELLPPIRSCQNHVPSRPVSVVSSGNVVRNGNIKPGRTFRARPKLRFGQPGVYHVCGYLNSVFGDATGSRRGEVVLQRTLVVRR